MAEAASNWCRTRTPACGRLVWCGVYGLFGFVCNDFGDAFVCSDTTGENPRSAIVSNIVPGAETLVSCVDDERIDFEEGDVVQLLEVDGMEGMAEREWTVKDVRKCSFKIGDTSGMTPYRGGGTVLQIKQPTTLKFAPISEAFDKPEVRASERASD